MKALALGLLLANVLYLAWSQWLDTDDAAGSSSAPPADVPKLVLASEAQGSTPSPSSDAPSPAPQTPDSEAVATAALPREESAAPVELLTSVQRCVSIGPFRELAEASQGSTALRSAGHDPRTRVAEGDVWAGLWVYLQALPSRSEAQRAVTLLKERGVQDAYIMPSAERAVDISLGIFSEPSRAQRRAEEVRALGFTPTVADRTRKGTVYWVDVDLKATDSLIDPSTLPGEQGKITRLEVKACPAAGSQPG